MPEYMRGGTTGVYRDLAAGYPRDVHPFAFRLAAGFLLTNVFLSMVAWALTGSVSVAALLVDAVLAVGLLDLRPGARSVTLVRAYAGAILLPALAYVQQGGLAAAVIAFGQLGYGGALVLVLQGELQRWRVVAAVGVFTVVVFANLLGFVAILRIAQ